MSTNTRLSVVAIVGIVLAGGGLIILRHPQVQVGSPSPSPSVPVVSSSTATPTLSSAAPSSSASLDWLTGGWASVGPRAASSSATPNVEQLRIDAAGVHIGTFKGDVTSTVSVDAATGLLTLGLNQAQAHLDNLHWDCRSGALGPYNVSLSADQQTLTISPAFLGDDCDSRQRILTGDWTRWSCPPPGFDSCAHVSERAPGRYLTSHFRPLFGGARGQLAYTIPSGWATLTQPPTWPSGETNGYLGLSLLAAPSEPSILVFSNQVPGAATFAAGPPASPGGCVAVQPAPNGNPVEVADFFEAQPYLTITGRKPVTLDGLVGIQLDVALVDGFIDPCSYGQTDGGPIEYSADFELFHANSEDGAGIYLSNHGVTLARFIIMGDNLGRIVIEMPAADQPSLQALDTTIMPVVDSFEFLR